MAMLAVPISGDISRLFREIDVDANRDPSDHITMFYFGDEIAVNKITKIIPLVFDITSKMQPFEAQCSKITTFPEGKHGFPVIGEIKSKELQDLRNKIKNLFKKNKIKFDEKFPDYKPHITLGYSDNKPEDIKLDKFKFTVPSIALYGGDNADSRIFVNFPFTLGANKTAKLNAFAGMYKNISNICHNYRGDYGEYKNLGNRTS